MRHLSLMLLLGLVVTGCAHQPPQTDMVLGIVTQIEPKPVAKPANPSTLPTMDLANTPLSKGRFKLDTFSIGGWVNQSEGPLFQKVTPSDPNAAIVYIYRINSRWNHQEVLAPNFFLNGKRIPSLRDNHYYWIELPAGTYRLNTSHPLAILHFQKGATVDFAVEAGKQYFLRYEEQAFRGKPDKDLGLLQAGPIMQMPTAIGLREISTTQLKTPGLSFVKRAPNFESASSMPAFNDKALTKVSNQSLESKETLETPNRFKLWNPLTW